MSCQQIADALIMRDVMVRMRDGVALATDVYLPDGDGPFPVLMERTPYGKTGTNAADRSRRDPSPRSKPEIAARFVERGYAYVLQDCRGRYGSEGVFTKYVNEAEDGVDTLGWILDQPWCSGRVGTLGLSYGAHVQAALAGLNPPGLAAMFLDSGGFSSAYHSGIRQGGAYELKQLTWARKHALLAPETAADPDRRAALEAEDIRKWMRVRWQRGHSPVSAAPEYERYIVEQWSAEVFSADWRRPGLFAQHQQFADVPSVHMSSWYDPYSLTAVENFIGLKHKLQPVKLVLGPWTHGQRSVSHAGNVDFGPAATLDGNLAPDYISLRGDWFDRHMLNLDAPEHLPSPVTIFVMGGGNGSRTPEGRLLHGGSWRREADWPLVDAVPKKFFLHTPGKLEEARPGTTHASIELRADPHHPVPTIGGAITSGAPVMFAGAYDQRETEDLFGATKPGRALADRDDVLTFRSKPLEEAVEVTGRVIAHLFIRPTTPDADIVIKLIDEYPPSPDWPQGFAMNLAHGILRLRFRDGFEEAKPMEPGNLYEVEIRSFPTSNLFAKGHRIRLDLSGSNFPHFDININGLDEEPKVARTQILCDRSNPSHIVLPIIAPRE